MGGRRRLHRRGIIFNNRGTDGQRCEDPAQHDAGQRTRVTSSRCSKCPRSGWASGSSTPTTRAQLRVRQRRRHRDRHRRARAAGRGLAGRHRRAVRRLGLRAPDPQRRGQAGHPRGDLRDPGGRWTTAGRPRFGDLSIHEFAADPEDQPRLRRRTTRAGFRTVGSTTTSGMSEVGRLHRPEARRQGQRLLGRGAVHVAANGERLIALSDRDYGLYIVRYKPPATPAPAAPPAAAPPKDISAPFISLLSNRSRRSRPCATAGSRSASASTRRRSSTSP